MKEQKLQTEEYYKEYLEILLKKYNKVILNRHEMSEELGISPSTLDNRIKRGEGIPKYKESADTSRATYIFPIVEVAKFMVEDLI